MNRPSELVERHAIAITNGAIVGGRYGYELEVTDSWAFHKRRVHVSWPPATWVGPMLGLRDAPEPGWGVWVEIGLDSGWPVVAPSETRSVDQALALSEAAALNLSEATLRDDTRRLPSPEREERVIELVVAELLSLAVWDFNDD